MDDAYPHRTPLTRISGFVVVGIGLTALLTWAAEMPLPHSLSRVWSPATPLPAVALLACGVSLIAHTEAGTVARGVARLAALAAGAIAALALTITLGGALGGERLPLAREVARAHGVGRPSPLWTLALLCAAVSLLKSERLRKFALALSVATAAFALAGFAALALDAAPWLRGTVNPDARAGALTFLGLLLTALGTSRLPRPSRPSSWLTLPATVAICLAAFTAAVAFAAVRQARNSAVMRRATLSAEIRAQTLRTVDVTIEQAEDAAAGAGAHFSPRSTTFAAIAHGILSPDRDASAITSIGLVDHVMAAERASFERRHGAIATLTGQAPAAALRRSPARRDYFVVTESVQDPAYAGPTNLGLDLGGVPTRRAALLDAARSGQARATPPVRSLATGRPVTALYVPIYRRGTSPPADPAQRVAQLRGFVSTSYRYDLLAPTLRATIPPGTAFSLYDGRVRLLSSGTPRHAAVNRIAVAGRTWTLAVGEPAVDLSLLAPIVLIGSLLTLLLAALSLQAARREREALELVDRRLAEREQAERALATAEERFRTAFAEAPIGIALTGTDGRFLQVNRALCRITGYSEADLLTLPAEQLSPPGDRRTSRLAGEAMLRGEITVHDFERRFVHAAGHTVWIAVHTTLVRDEQGEPAYFLSQIEDITERRRYEAQLQHMADHDPLTGLLNRRAYEQRLQEHLARGERYGHDGAVLVLDLDDFKQVNDTLGHGAGDELIVRVARALSSRLRESDTIARLGGDEFAILTPTGGRVDAEQLAQSLLGAIREQRAARGPGGRARPVSASIGIAPLAGSARLTAEEALINADLAMYDAKEAGRNRSETYGGPQHGRARIEAHLEWAERIRSALDEDRLTLLAQPVVETDSGRTTQHELLIRMLDASGDLIPPGSFLPVAERFGLIREIDRWVVTRAIQMLREQHEAGLSPTVEINLSGSSLGDPELAAHIDRELRGARVDPTQLIFEVTETTAIGNIAAARAFAEQLAELGCRFALDDFGAGFGSFYYLKHLPFDFIKIDGEFVRNCTADATDRLVIHAVVELAKGLGKRTIAEFVGDEETLATLRELGVDYAQGFHLGRPAPLDSWLGAQARGRTQASSGA